MALSLPQYPKFDVKADAVATRWKKWQTRLERVFVGYGIETPERRKALLLTFGGSDLADLVDSFPDEKLNITEAERTAGTDEYTKLVEVLTEHFNPRLNTEFQKYTFRKSVQTQSSVQEYY